MPKTGSASWPEVTTLAQEHDCLLIDLDGTVLCGDRPIDGAVQALGAVCDPTLFITNNASRRADGVAAHLGDLGFAATGDAVVTSGQSAARFLAEQLPCDSRVLIVGTEALAQEITAVGLTPVRRWQQEPVAVVQGHSTATCWSDLAEAALAIRAGALWVAANADVTLPSERGLLPGNGSMVAALRAATGAEPRVVGKPSPRLLTDALSRGEFRSPLVVGDRLDTDIAAANAAGLPSMMVLTGVNSARDAVYAVPGQRPTYIAYDLRSLHRGAGELAVAPQAAWKVDTSGATVRVGTAIDERDGDGLSVVRAVARAVWDADGPEGSVIIEAGDDTARDALGRWSLLSGQIG